MPGPFWGKVCETNCEQKVSLPQFAAGSSWPHHTCKVPDSWLLSTPLSVQGSLTPTRAYPLLNAKDMLTCGHFSIAWPERLQTLMAYLSAYQSW